MHILLFSNNLQPGWERYVIYRAALLTAVTTVIGFPIVSAAGIFGESGQSNVAAYPLIIGAIAMWFLLKRQYHVYASFGVAAGATIPLGIIIGPGVEILPAAIIAGLGFWLTVRSYSCGPYR